MIDDRVAKCDLCEEEFSVEQILPGPKCPVCNGEMVTIHDNSFVINEAVVYTDSIEDYWEERN